jgi:hypothetical protein
MRMMAAVNKLFTNAARRLQFDDAMPAKVRAASRELWCRSGQGLAFDHVPLSRL